jgi:hypothetical protein
LVGNECRNTDGKVLGARSIILECPGTNSRVVAAVVAKKRRGTDGRVKAAIEAVIIAS